MTTRGSSAAMEVGAGFAFTRRSGGAHPPIRNSDRLSCVRGRHGFPRSWSPKLTMALTVTASCRSVAPVIALIVRPASPSTSS